MDSNDEQLGAMIHRAGRSWIVGHCRNYNYRKKEIAGREPCGTTGPQPQGAASTNGKSEMQPKRLGPVLLYSFISSVTIISQK